MTYILGVGLLIAAYTFAQFGRNFVAQRDSNPTLRRLVGGDIYTLFPTILLPCGVAAMLSGPIQAMTWTSAGELGLSIAASIAAILSIRSLINRKFQASAPVAGPAVATRA